MAKLSYWFLSRITFLLFIGNASSGAIFQSRNYLTVYVLALVILVKNFIFKFNCEKARLFVFKTNTFDMHKTMRLYLFSSNHPQIGTMFYAFFLQRKDHPLNVKKTIQIFNPKNLVNFIFQFLDCHSEKIASGFLWKDCLSKTNHSNVNQYFLFNFM